MFWRAISQGIKVDYVLMDSWFTCEAFVKAVRRVKKQTVHLIGMYKTPKTKFTFNGERLTHSQIRNKLGNPGRCRKLKLHYKEPCQNITEWLIRFDNVSTSSGCTGPSGSGPIFSSRLWFCRSASSRRILTSSTFSW